MLVELLREEAYTPMPTHDGAAAMRVLETAAVPPDLIVLGLALPIMDGPTFVRQLQRHPTWRAIPIIVLSALPNASEIAKALTVSDCLLKPFDFEQLLSTIASRCSQLAAA
jgi:CheY-like chemotaxis protein